MFLIPLLCSLAGIGRGGQGVIELSQSMVPVTIDQPGSYMLTSDLVGVAGTNGITIGCSGVTVDLNGRALIGVPGSLNGIEVVAPVGDVTLRNGTIRDWDGCGVAAFAASNSVLERLVARSNLGDGMLIGFGSLVSHCHGIGNGPDDHGIDLGVGIEAEHSSTIVFCSASGNNQHGIIAHSASTVSDCRAFDNGHDGLHGSHGLIVQRSVAIRNDEGLEVDSCSTVVNSTVLGSLEDGIRIKRRGDGGGVVRNCTSMANGKDGIDGDAGTLVYDCVAFENTKHGIRVEPDSAVLHSLAVRNGDAGIKSGGDNARIEGNHLVGNFYGVAIEADMVNCLVVENSAVGNQRDYDIEAGAHVFEVTAPLPPNVPVKPWVNLQL